MGEITKEWIWLQIVLCDDSMYRFISPALPPNIVQNWIY